jgi:hypothetical protein
MVIDLGGDQGGELALWERLIFVQSLTGNRSLLVTSLFQDWIADRGRDCNQGGKTSADGSLHLRNSIDDIRPEHVDFRIQSFQGEHFELGVGLREKADQAGCVCEADHFCTLKLQYDQSSLVWISEPGASTGRSYEAIWGDR